MPRIVIAGAGPIGLYTAILLRERYPGFQVTVLDHRIGRFDRPGVIAIGALEAINASFATLGISPIEVRESGSHPPAIHIKDLQEALYKRVIDIRDVEFIDKDYFSVDHEGVKVIGDEDLESIGPCDLLIDCTGEDRAVTENLFDVENISDNPIKNHFIAYIYVDTDNDTLRSSGSTPPEALGVFRERTGWREFVEPDIDMRRWEGPEEHNGTSYAAKYCLYFEIPDWLNTTDPERSLQEYKTYLSELLKLKYGKEIQFVASTDKGAFGAFEVSPKHLRRFTGEIGAVPVVAIGDALISAEYRYGTGIKNGVAEAFMLTSSLRLSGKKITVNEEAWLQQPIGVSGYISNVDYVVGEHKRRICSDYASKKRSLLQKKEDAYIKYTQNPSTASGFDKLLFANHCKEKGDGFFKNLEWSKRQELYLEAIHLYEYCSENLSGSYVIEARDKQIKTISNLGKSYCKLNDFDQSIYCFLDAMCLAKKYGIMEMMDIKKLPKSLGEVVALKLNSLGSDLQGKKAFLEKLIDCLSSIEIDTNKYNEELKEIETKISNIDKIIEMKSVVHDGRINSITSEIDEDISDSKPTSSIRKNDINL